MILLTTLVPGVRAARQPQDLTGLAQAVVDLNALQLLLLFEVSEQSFLRCLKCLMSDRLLQHPIVVDRLAASPNLIARPK